MNADGGHGPAARRAGEPHRAGRDRRFRRSIVKVTNPSPLRDSRSATTLSDSRLAPAWAALRAGGRTALIPYLTAGYPDRDASEAALRAAADGVADIIEVGVPFSDPLADGPTIQRSTFEALQQGMTLAGTLELIARAELRTPVVVFSYLNPILRYGRRPLSCAMPTPWASRG